MIGTKTSDTFHARPKAQHEHASRLPGGRRSHAPRLDIRGPAWAGFILLALAFGAGLGAAGYVPIDYGIAVSGVIKAENKAREVTHHAGGIVGSILVREGDVVQAGDVIATLDTTEIDKQIKALKAQSDTARRQLELVRHETQKFISLVNKQAASKPTLQALERKLAEIEHEAAGFGGRIATAEREMGRMQIRAPVGGKVQSLSIKSTGAAILADATIAEIVPLNEPMVLEARLQTAQATAVAPGMKAKVRLSTQSWLTSRPLSARVQWVSPTTSTDKRTGAPYVLARLELDKQSAGPGGLIAVRPGMHAELLLLKAPRTLLDQLLIPVVRNLDRAFRS